MRWCLILSNKLSYLDDLSIWLDGDIQIRSIDDIASYELVSHHLDALQDEHSERAFFRSFSLLNLLRGAIYLTASGLPFDYRGHYLPIGLQFGKGDHTQFYQYINYSKYEPSPIEIEEYYYPFVDTLENKNIIKSDLGKLIYLSKENDTLNTILRLLGRRDVSLLDRRVINFDSLYKIFELITEKEGWDRNHELISSTRKDKFKKAANWPQASRDSARHGFLKGKIIGKDVPLSLLESINLIRELSIEWINSKLFDNSAVTYKPFIQYKEWEEKWNSIKIDDLFE